MKAGSVYQIGTVTHTFPPLKVKGKFRPSAALEAAQLGVLSLLQDLDQHGLDYIICGGTLLGAIRHQGFIPWDDDADIDLNESDSIKLEQCYAEHPSLFLKKTPFGYKLMRRGTLYPFVDIFKVSYDQTIQRYVYRHPWTRHQYPNYQNSHAELHPRRRYQFEHLTLWGPQEGEMLCTRLYGSDCFRIAVVDRDKHITEKWRDKVIRFFRRKVLKLPLPPSPPRE